MYLTNKYNEHIQPDIQIIAITISCMINVRDTVIGINENMIIRNVINTLEYNIIYCKFQYTVFVTTI